MSTDDGGGGDRPDPYQQQKPSIWVSGAGASSHRLSDENQVHENTIASAVPPISGQIPSPTGGIHSYQTEDRLRRRPTITTPKRHSRYSLDDADIAAGTDRLLISKCLSEPRQSSTPSTYHDTLRNRTIGRTNVLNIPSLTHGETYGGSEHDGMLLESSHSVLDDYSDDHSYKGKPLNANITIPPAVDDTIPLPLTNRFVVLGWDLSQHTRQSQFLISAGGTFCFSLLYGYLQELISVDLCNRKLGLFLAAAQFTGYTILSYFFRNLDKGVNVNRGVGVNSAAASGMSFSRRLRRLKNWGRLRDRSAQSSADGAKIVPIELYVGLSVLRAIDLGMTNLAMQYVNYPAKTLMKSTRLVFTMLFGVIITKKRYNAADYGIVCLMVAGLALFMHADSTSSAVFQPVGIVMLTISLLCDGAISNMSEAIMNKYNVGQDEFIFRLYSIALFFVCIAASANGDLRHGLAYLTTPGTLKEMDEGLAPTWSIQGKILTMVIFSTTGFFGSSCSAAITKSFGALTMSITSTARKATTIFLSFALFPNECTSEHIFGIILFIASLVTKSLRASKRGRRHQHKQHYAPVERDDISHDVANECGGISLAPLPLHLKMRGNHLGHDVV